MESNELAWKVARLEEKVASLQEQAQADHEILAAIQGAVTIPQITAALRKRADWLTRDGQLRSGLHMFEVSANIRLGQQMYGLANDLERPS